MGGEKNRERSVVYDYMIFEINAKAHQQPREKFIRHSAHEEEENTNIVMCAE